MTFRKLVGRLSTFFIIVSIFYSTVWPSCIRFITLQQLTNSKFASLIMIPSKSGESEQLITACKEAINYFIHGQQTKLKQSLDSTNQYRNQNNSQKANQKQSPQNKSKFAYDINFEDGEQGQNKDKQARKRPKPKAQPQRQSQFCIYCPGNQQLHLLSASNYVYLAMPKLKTFRKYAHFILCPVDHIQTKIGADEGVLEEIKNYQKCLIQMLEKMNLHAIFLQQFCTNNSHIYIQCIGIPLKKAYDLPFFFKQALENVEGFWTTHKRIIEIRKEKGGLEKQIPKQMKYFYIDFGLGYGYAHVIQDQKQWDRNFCYEIVASALGMQSYEVKTSQQYGAEELEMKSKEFGKQWKPFDWTVLIQNQGNEGM